MSDAITFTLNGKPARVSVDGERALLWVLRTELGLTGTKYGCGEGYCGACTVLVDGVAERSCLLRAKDIEGKTVVTIEGMAKDRKLHPVQKWSSKAQKSLRPSGQDRYLGQRTPEMTTDDSGVPAA